MRVHDILRRVLGACRFIHQRRLRTLFAAVEVVISGAALTLTSVGRAIANAGSHKHGIKRVDRFLANVRVWADLPVVLRAVCSAVIGDAQRPIICIDWTGAASGLWALVAAVPVMGRAVPVLFEVHPQSSYTARRVHDRFLRRLARLLPADCCPIVIADAGFKGPFMKKLDQLGWGFVIRIRGRRRLGSGRISIDSVFQRAGTHARDLVDCSSNAMRLILSATPRPASRKRRRPANRNYRTAAREPWVLATNLWHHTPEQIVQIYAVRMRIEETFRDTKSHRLGWGLEDALNRTPQRVVILLLIGALASLTTVLAGMAAERRGLARYFQANTVRSYRVLSVFTLGRLVLNHVLRERILIRHLFARVLLRRLVTDGLSPRANGLPFDRYFVSHCKEPPF